MEPCLSAKIKICVEYSDGKTKRSIEKIVPTKVANEILEYMESWEDQKFTMKEMTAFFESKKYFIKP